MCHVLPLSSERQTPGFFGSRGIGVGEAAGLAAGAALAEGEGLGVAPGDPPPPGFGSSPPVPALAPTSICAYTTFGFDRETSMPMRPSNPSGSPFPCSFVHVLPASVVFQIPEPGPPPLNPHEVRRR